MAKRQQQDLKAESDDYMTVEEAGAFLDDWAHEQNYRIALEGGEYTRRLIAYAQEHGIEWRTLEGLAEAKRGWDEVLDVKKRTLRGSDKGAKALLNAHVPIQKERVNAVKHKARFAEYWEGERFRLWTVCETVATEKNVVPKTVWLSVKDECRNLNREEFLDEPTPTETDDPAARLYREEKEKAKRRKQGKVQRKNANRPRSKRS